MRKPTQTDLLLKLLSDGMPHSTAEICRDVYGADHLGCARIGARIFELRRKGHRISGHKSKENAAIYVYRMDLGTKSLEAMA